MIIGFGGSRHKNMINSLGGSKKRRFSTAITKETEQSTKWDKLEGKLSSDFVDFDVLKDIKPLSKDIIFPETMEKKNMILETIPFIYKSWLVTWRWDQKPNHTWFHIPTKEKTDLANKLLSPKEKKYPLCLVGPTGLKSNFYFLSILKN